jgi:hypothetical protein
VDLGNQDRLSLQLQGSLLGHEHGDENCEEIEIQEKKSQVGIDSIQLRRELMTKEHDHL